MARRSRMISAADTKRLFGREACFDLGWFSGFHVPALEIVSATLDAARGACVRPTQEMVLGGNKKTAGRWSFPLAAFYRGEPGGSKRDRDIAAAK
jgi:hypothetical protein